MWAPGPARVLAHAMAIALAALIFPRALAAPIESVPPQRAPILSPDRPLELEAMRQPDPVRLAAIDPKAPDSGESHSARAEPFGSMALQAPEGELWRQWRRV
jgi:hypothetical protein